MTKILNIGGDLIDLYADYEYARDGDNSTSAHRYKDLRKTAKILRDSDAVYKQVNDPGNYETIGGAIGLGLGVVYGYATLPVVAIDGPLPFMDLTWAYGTARFTKKSIETGRRFGKHFD